MVNLDFVRPSLWSFGQKVGALAILFLVLGPFLPYWERDYKPGGAAFVLYADVFIFGLLLLIPLMSAVLILLLMYFKFGVYIEEDGKQKRINHIILMMWGSVFFFIYLADALRAPSYSTGSYDQYAGFGLWIIVMGYLLCTLAGYLQWQKPHMVGPQLLIKRIEPPVEISSNGGYPISPYEESPLREIPKNGHNENAPKNWSNHVSGNGRTIEQCKNCNKYTFFTTEKSGDSVTYHCNECNSSFVLNK